MTAKFKQPHTMWPQNTAERKYFKYCDEYNQRERESIRDKIGGVSKNVDSLRHDTADLVDSLRTAMENRIAKLEGKLAAAVSENASQAKQIAELWKANNRLRDFNRTRKPNLFVRFRAWLATAVIRSLEKQATI